MLARYLVAAGFVAMVAVPSLAFAQNVDPTTTVAAILAWLTGPFGKTSIAVLIGITAFACILGHHPYAALGAVALGSFLLFGSNFMVAQFVGG